MKAKELRPCGICGNGLMHTGVPLFYRVTIEVMGIDLQAVRERRGLEMLFGDKPGSAALAEVFAPTGEVANRVHDPDSMLICQQCAANYEHACILRLAELASKTKEST